MVTASVAEKTAYILKYNEVVTYLFSEYRKRFSKELIDSQSKATINKSLAEFLTETGITVRPKWIADLRAEVTVKYDKADKVLRATNNILRKFEFELIPENAIVVIEN
jgi:hypothetical protein